MCDVNAFGCFTGDICFVVVACLFNGFRGNACFVFLFVLFDGFSGVFVLFSKRL
jgi:hypothetical protein